MLGSAFRTPPLTGPPSQDPLGWELWAMAELNVILSLNWQRLSSFGLEPQWNLPAQEPKQALEEFHEIHGYGSPSRVIQAVIRRCAGCSYTVWLLRLRAASSLRGPRRDQSVA